uniref:Claudin 23.1 n=1 Tax=Astyanax mexicanus TaxID=7994 RepID=A0A3B1IKZ0_ASTMX
MRSPCIVIFGLILSPCGWVLDLTSMIVPHWRTVHNITGEDPGMVLYQGIWHTCSYYGTLSSISCDNDDEDYFDHRIIETAKRMMAASLIMTAIGLAVATFGVRCWSPRPRWTGVCLGGFVIVCSGLLAIMPVAWYAHVLNDISSPSTEMHLGVCIFLGYLGGDHGSSWWIHPVCRNLALRSQRSRTRSFNLPSGIPKQRLDPLATAYIPASTWKHHSSHLKSPRCP